ncbi:hypothetical protein CGRA01v4_00813 [Colletotrichum graminicola]|nr:hypothetical protein CGRA01v4_00813 [Colletotrichum graminicola]
MTDGHFIRAAKPSVVVHSLTLLPLCWTLDAGRWTLDAGRWTLGSRERRLQTVTMIAVSAILLLCLAPWPSPPFPPFLPFAPFHPPLVRAW